MFDSHNIFKCNLIFLCRIFLDLFCSRKIHQIFLNNHFCQLIACVRDHTVSCNASFFCDTDIGCTCTHIHKCNIQHTEILRNSHINCRNRLQCQIGNLKSRLFYSRIKSIYNVLRQEGNNNIFFNKIRFMTL